MIYQLEYVHYPRAYVNVTKTLAEDLNFAGESLEGILFFSSGVITCAVIGDLECIYGNSPDLLLPGRSPSAQPDSIDRPFFHQRNICFKRGMRLEKFWGGIAISRLIDLFFFFSCTLITGQRFVQILFRGFFFFWGK